MVIPFQEFLDCLLYGEAHCSLLTMFGNDIGFEFIECLLREVNVNPHGLQFSTLSHTCQGGKVGILAYLDKGFAK